LKIAVRSRPGGFATPDFLLEASESFSSLSFAVVSSAVMLLSDFLVYFLLVVEIDIFLPFRRPGVKPA